MVFKNKNWNGDKCFTDFGIVCEECGVTLGAHNLTDDSCPVTAETADGWPYLAGKPMPASLADGARYRCRRCGEQNDIEFNYAKLVTHFPDGTPRDDRDIASDPAGKLIHDPVKPLFAPTPVFRKGVSFIADIPVGAKLLAFDGIIVVCAPGMLPHFVTPTGLTLVPRADGAD